MTHEVRYGSRNIGRYGDSGFAPRVLEIGKVHGDGTTDESTVESARWGLRSDRSNIREGFRARETTM